MHSLFSPNACNFQTECIVYLILKPLKVGLSSDVGKKKGAIALVALEIRTN